MQIHDHAGQPYEADLVDGKTYRKVEAERDDWRRAAEYAQQAARELLARNEELEKDTILLNWIEANCLSIRVLQGDERTFTIPPTREAVAVTRAEKLAGHH